MHVVVTGAAGFLGSHLCEHFLSAGAEVTGVDNLSTGTRRNLDDALSSGSFRFVEADVCALADLDARADVVYHLASPASPPRYLALPIETLRAGSAGTEAAIQLSLRSGARFVLASSSEVYGSAEIHPQRETYWGNVNPIGPRSVYDEAKRYAEALTFAYRRQFGLNGGVVRIFNTYGPRLGATDGRVVSNFIRQALENEPLTIYGEGTQTRSLCYVDDLIDALAAMGRVESAGPVNLGNPTEVTVRELAAMVVRLTGSSSGVEHHALPIDDPPRRRPDVSRARDVLSWSPSTSLEDGLQRTIAWQAGNPEPRK